MVQAELRMARFLVDVDGTSRARPTATGVPAALLALRARLRTRGEFLAHVRRCYGARLMLSDADARLLGVVPKGEEKEEQALAGPPVRGARCSSALAVVAPVAE